MFTTPDGVPVNVSSTESLATAICCDKRTKVFAEPRSLYEVVSLFKETERMMGQQRFTTQFPVNLSLLLLAEERKRILRTTLQSTAGQALDQMS